MPFDAGWTRPSTACPATTASNAFPPARRIRSAVSVASDCIEEIAYSRPRRTGRSVRAAATAGGLAAGV